MRLEGETRQSQGEREGKKKWAWPGGAGGDRWTGEVGEE